MRIIKGDIIIDSQKQSQEKPSATNPNSAQPRRSAIVPIAPQPAQAPKPALPLTQIGRRQVLDESYDVAVLDSVSRFRIGIISQVTDNETASMTRLAENLTNRGSEYGGDVYASTSVYDGNTNVRVHLGKAELTAMQARELRLLLETIMNAERDKLPNDGKTYYIDMVSLAGSGASVNSADSLLSGRLVIADQNGDRVGEPIQLNLVDPAYPQNFRARFASMCERMRAAMSGSSEYSSKDYYYSGYGKDFRASHETTKRGMIFTRDSAAQLKHLLEDTLSEQVSRYFRSIDPSKLKEMIIAANTPENPLITVEPSESGIPHAKVDFKRAFSLLDKLKLTKSEIDFLNDTKKQAGFRQGLSDDLDRIAMGYYQDVVDPRYPDAVTSESHRRALGFGFNLYSQGKAEPGFAIDHLVYSDRKSTQWQRDSEDYTDSLGRTQKRHPGESGRTERSVSYDPSNDYGTASFASNEKYQMDRTSIPIYNLSSIAGFGRPSGAMQMNLDNINLSSMPQPTSPAPSNLPDFAAGPMFNNDASAMQPILQQNAMLDRYSRIVAGALASATGNSSSFGELDAVAQRYSGQINSEISSKLGISDLPALGTSGIATLFNVNGNGRITKESILAAYGGRISSNQITDEFVNGLNARFSGVSSEYNNVTNQSNLPLVTREQLLQLFNMSEISTPGAQRGTITRESLQQVFPEIMTSIEPGKVDNVIETLNTGLRGFVNEYERLESSRVADYSRPIGMVGYQADVYKYRNTDFDVHYSNDEEGKLRQLDAEKFQDHQRYGLAYSLGANREAGAVYQNDNSFGRRTFAYYADAAKRRAEKTQPFGYFHASMKPNQDGAQGGWVGGVYERVWSKSLHGVGMAALGPSSYLLGFQTDLPERDTLKTATIGKFGDTSFHNLLVGRSSGSGRKREGWEFERQHVDVNGQFQTYSNLGLFKGPSWAYVTEYENNSSKTDTIAAGTTNYSDALLSTREVAPGKTEHIETRKYDSTYANYSITKPKGGGTSSSSQSLNYSAGKQQQRTLETASGSERINVTPLTFHLYASRNSNSSTTLRADIDKMVGDVAWQERKNKGKGTHTAKSNYVGGTFGTDSTLIGRFTHRENTPSSGNVSSWSVAAGKLSGQSYLNGQLQHTYTNSNGVSSSLQLGYSRYGSHSGLYATFMVNINF